MKTIAIKEDLHTNMKVESAKKKISIEQFTGELFSFYKQMHQMKNRRKLVGRNVGRKYTKGNLKECDEAALVAKRLNADTGKTDNKAGYYGDVELKRS